jgi:hypothetical protein
MLGDSRTVRKLNESDWLGNWGRDIIVLIGFISTFWGRKKKKEKSKAVPLRAMETHGGRGVPTHT